MSTEDESIHDLLERVRQGDAAAIKHLYSLCSIVYPHVLRLCGDPVLAREIHQDTVTEIWKGNAPFRGEAKFSTWVISIARNLAFKALKARSREPLQAIDAGDGLGEHDELQPVDGSAGSDPFDALAERQRREGVLCCIDKLSPKLGECLLLVHYADMSQSEVAALLGLSINTVKTRLREAHKRIEGCLRRLVH